MRVDEIVQGGAVAHQRLQRELAMPPHREDQDGEEHDDQHRRQSPGRDLSRLPPGRHPGDATVTPHEDALMVRHAAWRLPGPIDDKSALRRYTCRCRRSGWSHHDLTSLA